MQLVTFKMKENSLKRLDRVVKGFSFGSRTEFMRSAIREKVEDYETRQAIERLRKLKGSLKGKIKQLTPEEKEKVREEAWQEYEKMGEKGRLQLLREYGFY